MKFSTFFAAAASISLMAAPVTAAPPVSAAVAPASETVEGEEIYGASILLQVGILLVVAVAIYFGAKALSKDDKPASP